MPVSYIDIPSGVSQSAKETSCRIVLSGGMSEITDTVPLPRGC
jgi:hypothetical protein